MTTMGAPTFSNSDRRSRGFSEHASKVPAATAVFWTTKALTTAMGESSSDFLVHRFPPAGAVVVGFFAFCAALALQFRASRCVPWIYWLTVAMVGVFGTMAADVLHVGLGIPYAVSTACFVVALVGIFTTWYSVEKTLSIHSITTVRREIFYWLAVVTTFALGTALGDLTAITMHLGYWQSGVMFAGLILVPAIGYRFLRLNAIAAFWSAYILTRPLGASFADWMGVPANRGGLDLGPGWVSLTLIVLILCLVAAQAISDSATQPRRIARP